MQKFLRVAKNQNKVEKKMSGFAVLFTAVFTCTWSSLRLVQGPRPRLRARMPVVDSIQFTERMEQLTLPIGKRISVHVASSRKSHLKVRIERPQWAQYIQSDLQT